MTPVARVWHFVQLTRPGFLLGGALLYSLGAAYAVRRGGAAFDGTHYALGVVLVAFIQLMTHYANEYYDLEGDRLIGDRRTWFSGGSGALVDGRLRPRTARIAAGVCAAGALAAIGVAAAVHQAVGAIGLVALLLGWFYSAPPLRLVASGFGEAATALLLCVLTPLCGALLQGAWPTIDLAWIALPLALVNVAMLLIFELVDYDADRQSGKRTLAVRVGPARATVAHHALIVLAFCGVGLAALIGWLDRGVAAWLLIAIPLAAWQIAAARLGPGRDWRRAGWLSAGAVGLFALMAASFVAGLLTA